MVLCALDPQLGGIQQGSANVLSEGPGGTHTEEPAFVAAQA